MPLKANIRRVYLTASILLLCMPGNLVSNTAAEDLGVNSATIQEATQGLLSFLSFSIVPDSTISSLKIDNSSEEDATLLLTQFGGGFTLSNRLPIYLEGFLGYAKYDPDFVISGEAASDQLKAKWRTFSATAGIGYDFRIATEWVLRPIANFSLSHMTSTASLVGLVLGDVVSGDSREAIEWLDDGWLTAGGAGGSLVLDFERRRKAYEADVELRYTHYYLTSLDSSDDIGMGHTNTATLGLWTRLRVPTGLTALGRPVRAVFEGAYSWFANSQTDVLGFDQLAKIGLGAELDLSKYNLLVNRARVVGRCVFGNNISGWSISFAVSF